MLALPSLPTCGPQVAIFTLVLVSIDSLASSSQLPAVRRRAPLREWGRTYEYPCIVALRVRAGAGVERRGRGGRGRRAEGPEQRHGRGTGRHGRAPRVEPADDPDRRLRDQRRP